MSISSDGSAANVRERDLRDEAHAAEVDTAFPATLVIDATYRCNSPCRYCRWGSSSTDGREDMSLAALRLSSTLLRRLSTNRVVICGGEPLLYPHLTSLVRHYAASCEEVVAVTNGLLLSPERLAALHEAGLTGVIVSLDSTNPAVFRANRGLDARALRRVLDNVEAVAAWRPSLPFELGINAVITRASCTVTNVVDLMAFAEQLDVDAVKFAPVFDDGYAGTNAPELLLDAACGPALDAVATLSFPSRPRTNPPQFWRDVARLARGNSFHGSHCGLDGRTALLARGRLTLCYWVPETDIELPSGRRQLPLVARRSLATARRALQQQKDRCDVGASCWCMQRLDHTWQKVGSP